MLRCPRCKVPLISHQSVFACNQCSRKFATDGGIIDLRLDALCDDIADDDLHRLTEQLSAENWAASIQQVASSAGDIAKVLYELTADGRFAWKIFLNLDRDAVLLDVGCGYGNATHNLAPHVGRVFALETSQIQLKFAQKRFSLFNPQDEITLVNCDQPGVLPFADNTFDIVIVSGFADLANGNDTFDAGERTRRAPPRAIDKTPLHEANRVLKQDGQLLFVAQNLLDPAYLCGLTENSANWLRKSALMRSLATPYFVWRSRREKAVRGYSALSYRLQTKSAGFARTTLFGLTGQNALNEIIPYGPKVTSQHGGGRSLKRRLRRHPLFVPGFVVISEKSTNAASSSHARLFEQIGRDIAQNGAAKSLTAQRYLVTRKDKLVILAMLGDRGVVVRIPFSDAAKAAEARHSDMITWFASAQSNVGISPENLTEGRIDGIDYRVETMLPGHPLRAVLNQHGHTALLEEISTLLTKLNPPESINFAPLEGKLYERLVNARLDRLSMVVTDASEQNRLKNFFYESLHGARIPVGVVHGDFSISNIYTMNGRATGIIDWESASRDDLPILDAIGYLESTHRAHNRKHRINQSISALAARKFHSKEEERFLFAQYERFSIDPKHHPGLVYLRWLRLVDYLLPYWLKYNPVGQQTYIDKVVQSLPPSN